MESAWTVTRKERARKGIDHSLARTTGRKIMIRVLHVQEVLIPQDSKQEDKVDKRHDQKEEKTTQAQSRGTEGVTRNQLLQ